MSSKYWRKREAEALKKYIKDEKKYSRTLNGYYNDMFREVEKEIELFYAKYAKKEKISLAEAKLRISKADIEDFARKAKKYVKEKNFSKQANEEMRLYNATMRINRLEMLKAQIGMELVAGHNDVESEMEQILSDRAQEEATRMAGILGKSVNLDPKTLGNIVNASFHNATFSQRIWTNQSALRDELSRKLQSGIMQGKNPRELARDLRRTFDVNKFNAERLMRTELARVQTDVQMKSFEANGFDAYEFIANENDGKTCAVCKELDGKIFKLKDAEVGENLPPMHPMCRCSTAAAMDDEAYNEWLDGYKEHGLSFEDWKCFEDVTKEYISKATPKTGVLTQDVGYKMSAHHNEIRVSELLHNIYGGNIRLLNDKRNATKNPDYLWNDKLWELKSPNSLKGTDDLIRTGIKQIRANPGGIILDYKEGEASVNEVLGKIGYRMIRSSDFSTDIIIIINNAIKKVYRYKK